MWGAAAGGPVVNASYNQSEQRDHSTNYTNASLTAADTLLLNVKNDATLIGATIHADKGLTATIGGDLTLESLQNLAYGSSKGTGVSGGMGYEGVYTNEGGAGADPEKVTLTTAPGQTGDAATANAGVSLSNGSYYTKETVLSSITSGGPLNIDVAGHTDITGALIASIDESGKDTGQLTLNTGSLSFTDLRNTRQSSDSTVALNTNVLLNEDKAPEKGTTNVPQDSKGEDQPTGTTNLGIHQNSSESAGKTLATIGNGSITVGGEATEQEGLNRDVEAVEKELYSIDRVKGDLDLTVDNQTLEEVADKVNELVENFNKLSPEEQALLQAQLSAMDEAIQKGLASDDQQERELAEKLQAGKELLVAKLEGQQSAQESDPQLAGAPTLSGKSFEEMQNEFAAVKGALSGWYTDIQQGGEQSYEDGVYRGEVSAYAYNSAPAFGSETDYSGATAFYQTQREAAYASLGLWAGASSGSMLDYAGWTAASMTNETWQGVQFAGKAATLGLFSNPFDGSSYHSLIGDGTLFGSPQSFTGAMGVEQGKVASYFAGIEGLAVLGLKGAKYAGTVGNGDEVLASVGSIDFYVKSDGTTIPGTGYRVIGGDTNLAEAMSGEIASRNPTYFTFDNVKNLTPSEAQNFLQTNPDYLPSHVVEFNTLQILHDISIPMGRWNTTQTPEPITTTFPEWGDGGATQAITNSSIKVTPVNVSELKMRGSD